MAFFLDKTGLSHFWDKAKEYIKSKYVGIGDTIEINYNNSTHSSLDGVGLNLIGNDYKLQLNRDKLYFLDVNKNNPNIFLNGACGAIFAKGFIKYDGTSSQFLMADGSISEFNKANGVPKLNANGKLDSSQIDALTDAEIDAIVV